MKPLTQKQMASAGGTARGKALSKRRRKAIAIMGAKARWIDTPKGR